MKTGFGGLKISFDRISMKASFPGNNTTCYFYYYHQHHQQNVDNMCLAILPWTKRQQNTFFGLVFARQKWMVNIERERERGRGREREKERKRKREGEGVCVSDVGQNEKCSGLEIGRIWPSARSTTCSLSLTHKPSPFLIHTRGVCLCCTI